MLYLDYARRAGRVDPQPLRRSRESRGGRVPQAAEPRRVPRPPRHADDRRGIHRLADGVAADLPRRPRLRPEVEHGLDARHARVLPAGPDAPQVPPQPAHLQPLVRLQRELRAAALARRGGARQGLAHRQDARATSGSSSPTCGCCSATCGRIRARSCSSWAGSSASGASGSTRRASSGTCSQYPLHAGVQRWVRDLNRLYREHAGAARARLQRQRASSWIDCDDADVSVIAFLRRDRAGAVALIACNFTPVPREQLPRRRAARRPLARAPQQRRRRLRRQRPGQPRRARQPTPVAAHGHEPSRCSCSCRRSPSSSSHRRPRRGCFAPQRLPAVAALAALRQHGPNRSQEK